MPYDQFVRNILTAKGTASGESAAAVYQALGKEPGPSVSQLFLGVRLECAKCHQHPAERWNPRDFYAFGGFFTGVKNEGPNLVPVEGKDLENQFLKTKEKETVPAAALGAAPADFSNTLDSSYSTLPSGFTCCVRVLVLQRRVANANHRTLQAP